ncbi:MAG: desulfoferrodoxin [Methanolobus sp.]|nr:desulfoferrodoxin [Methanolobus sp.]
MDKSCDMQVGERYLCGSCGFEMEVVTPCDICDEGRIMCPCCGEPLEMRE